MPQSLEENGYQIEITSSNGNLGWSAEARADALYGAVPVDPVHTLAFHETMEDAERTALNLLRARIRGEEFD